MSRLQQSQWIRSVRRAGVGFGLALVAAASSGCASLPSAGIDFSSGFLGLSSPEPGKPKTLPELRQTHLENPGDATATVAYARGLKSSGRAKEALALVETAAGAQPENQQLVVEQGLLALELGQTAKAQHALLRANPETTADWKVLSGLGVAHAGLGQNAKAQDYFQRALALSPNNPTVLNNLALSYILDKKVDQGRELLQQASAAGGDKPQIARNLEMAMALKGGSKAKDKGKAAPAVAGSTAIAQVAPATSVPVLAPVTKAHAAASKTARKPAVTPAAPPGVPEPATGESGSPSALASAPSPNTIPAALAVPADATAGKVASLDPSGTEKSMLEDVPPQVLQIGGLLHGR